MQNIKQEYIIPEQLGGLRFDQAVASLCQDFSRSQLKNWIVDGTIVLDGKKTRPRDKVKAAQRITIDVSFENPHDWEGEAIDLDIIFEDEDLIVINKPRGLVVHPGAGNPTGTLANALLNHAKEMHALPRGGIVHRLDKDTTGLMVAVKTPLAYQDIIEQLATHEMGREYEAITKGVLISGGTIEEPIGRHPKSRVKMAVHPNGKEAITHYRVIKRYREHTHVRVNLETGRTHQIRVHMDYKGYPLLGDKTYGTHKKAAKKGAQDYNDAINHFTRQALHAKTLTLTHPRTGELMSWSSPLPDDMVSLLSALDADLERSFD